MAFARNESAGYERLTALVKDLHIAILINNVGKSHDIPIPFLETTEGEMGEVITIDVNGTLRVIQIAAPSPACREREPIPTMSSIGGFLPTPFLVIYSGSKAFGHRSRRQAQT